jgi:hypothetical protein
MPNINLLPEVLYQAMQPYHVDYDNLPLRTILAREEIINDAVDVNSQMMREAIGTAGTLSNRLRIALYDDGSLKASAINTALHNIAYHTDGSDGVTDYVRMLQDERNKLTLIADEATALSLKFITPSATVSFIDEIVEFEPSDTITWEADAPAGGPNTVKAHMAFPTTAVHQHYYGLTPVTTNYINYRTTSLSTPFIADSLRVYINGVRIFSDDTVYVPDALVTTWILTSFTPSPTLGTFVLSRALVASDVIRIDFDTLYV